SKHEATQYQPESRRLKSRKNDARGRTAEYRNGSKKQERGKIFGKSIGCPENDGNRSEPAGMNDPIARRNVGHGIITSRWIRSGPNRPWQRFVLGFAACDPVFQTTSARCETVGSRTS